MNNYYPGQKGQHEGYPRIHRHIENTIEDKVEWVRHLVSVDIRVNTVYRAEKQQFCTGPQDILIDDYDKNICEWQAAGGTGILFRDSQQTLEELQQIVGSKSLCH